MLKEQKKDEIEVSHSESKLMVDENVPGETETQENLSFHDAPIELLPEDELLPEVELRLGGSTSVELPPFPLEEGIVKPDLTTSLHSEIKGLVNSLWYLSRRFP